MIACFAPWGCYVSGTFLTQKKFFGTNGPGCYIGSWLEHHLFKFWMLMHRTINVNLPECLKMVDLRSTGGNSAWVRALQLALWLGPTGTVAQQTPWFELAGLVHRKLIRTPSLQILDVDAQNHQCQFARVVKGVDLTSTGGNSAWVRAPQLTVQSGPNKLFLHMACL